MDFLNLNEAVKTAINIMAINTVAISTAVTEATAVMVLVKTRVIRAVIKRVAIRLQEITKNMTKNMILRQKTNGMGNQATVPLRPKGQGRSYLGKRADMIVKSAVFIVDSCC